MKYFYISRNYSIYLYKRSTCRYDMLNDCTYKDPVSTPPFYRPPKLDNFKLASHDGSEYAGKLVLTQTHTHSMLFPQFYRVRAPKR